jgi:hypothetical protein
MLKQLKELIVASNLLHGTVPTTLAQLSLLGKF